MELEQIAEPSLEQYIELSESLKRLETNPDFKKVFLDFYLVNWVAGRTSLLATIYKNNRTEVMEQLISAANFQSFLAFIKNMGDTARAEQKLNEVPDDSE